MTAKEFTDPHSKSGDRIFLLAINDTTAKTVVTEPLFNELFSLSITFLKEVHKIEIDLSKGYNRLPKYQGDPKWLETFFVSSNSENMREKREIKIPGLKIDEEKNLTIPFCRRPIKIRNL
ncbi:uncharacterized protein LOC115228229 [Octopus sinensis]|uniref:Uncharacterized protein LOC115228229 n=1 Tax=Octopus sinensis TaxID=2607531 RepID=A0A6P7TXT1_9MOLL|nr:uncharacterized protein LOC115228229 [Octopus sinensis]